jgi:glycosyltransferase involved in cell wall biosynthesis
MSDSPEEAVLEAPPGEAALGVAPQTAPATEPQPAPPPRPVRVAWIAGADSFEDYVRVLQPLAVGLMDEMIEAVVFCPASAAERVRAAVPFDVVTYPDGRWWLLRESSAEPLRAELRKRKVALLHGLDASAAKLTARLGQTTGLGYLLSSYSLTDSGRLGEGGRGAWALLAASEPIREALEEHAGGGRVYLVRPGVYHVRHATCFSEPDRSAAILAGGPLVDEPAYEAVLQCFRELVARKVDCALFLLGSGPAERRLRERANHLGLGAHLTFVDSPRMDDLTGIFRSADLYIAPVVREEVDMQSLLAMAAGVPVLAAAGHGADDFLRDGQTVLAFARASAAELVAKVTNLLADYAAARALAEGAIRYIHEHHSPAANVALLAKLYRRAAAERATDG